MIDFKIEGLKRLDDALKALPENLARRELAGALRAGGNVVRKEAVARAPDSPKVHKYGDLRANIRVRRARPQAGGVLAVAISTGRAFYAKWLEFGRGPVVAKKGKLLSDGTQVFGKRIAAQPPRPFMRPAFDAAAPRAIDTIAARLKAGVARQVARLRGGKTG